MGYAENALVHFRDELREAKDALARAGFEHTDQGWVPVRDTAKRPEILATNFELVRILEGNPAELTNLGGTVSVTVRMYTPSELIAAQRMAAEKVSAEAGIPMAGPMSHARAVELTETLEEQRLRRMF